MKIYYEERSEWTILPPGSESYNFPAAAAAFVKI